MPITDADDAAADATAASLPNWKPGQPAEAVAAEA